MDFKKVFLIIMTMVGTIYLFATPVKADSLSGSWGDVPWEFNSTNGTLTLVGGGTLDTYVNAPWNGSATKGMAPTDVKKIVFTETVYAPTDSTYLFGTGSSSTGLSNLNLIEGLNYLDTSNVTNMTYMFNYIGVASLDLSNFRTSNVTNMSAMFANGRRLTSLNLSSFDTNKVTNMLGMFYSNTNLVSLDLSSFTVKSNTNISNFFYNTPNLRQLTLGPNSVLSTKTNLAPISTNSGVYTGRWVGSSSGNKGQVYSSTNNFVTKYSGEYPGTYVWEVSPSLTVKDITIKTTDSWSASDNFVSGNDNIGTSLNSSDITVSGTVNTKKSGTYPITYTYGSISKTATVTVEDVPAILTVQFIQGNAIFSDYTLTLGGYNVWDEVDLNTIESIINNKTSIENNGYSVKDPAKTTIILETKGVTVQYKVIGSIELVVPSTLDFGKMVYTGEKQILSAKIDGNLAIKDRVAPNENSSWSLYASISSPLKNDETNELAKGASFNYVNTKAVSFALSSTNQLIKNAASGGSELLSSDWGSSPDSAGIKLTLDPSINTGKYSAVITWSLQTGPES